ncbi:MAG: hypothetical protein J7483_08640 [Novosphingobium sp.]|nr:hypothetical protein [Novosphingobium sp.]
MYGKNDLRATLAPKATHAPETPFKGASYARFYEEPPSEENGSHATWYARGQNLIVAYSRVKPGAVLSRDGQIDEYALLIPESGMRVTVSAGEESQTVAGPSIVFIPPGASTIEALDEGDFYRLITTRSADLAAKCSNAAAYAEQDPNVPEFEAWPDPVGGWKIRAYSGDVPAEQGRFGRLYRGSTIMVNFGSGRPGPRDPSNLSPHHHDDFEQYSIATAGDFVHHLRWPWLSDSRDWREDEHAFCASPSVAVIPPPATHTSQGMGEGLNRLADAFCPPRRDFSVKPGWVLNAADYPMPEDA